MLNQLTHRVPVVFKTLLERKLNAPEFLIQDHIRIEALFLRMRILARLAESFPSRRKDFMKRRALVFGKIREGLERHAGAEETILYPECEGHVETRSFALEAYEAHHQIKTLLKDLVAISMEREEFDAKLNLLIKDVAHHVREEEEELLPRMRKVFSASHLLRIGSQLRGYKKHTRRANVSAA